MEARRVDCGDINGASDRSPTDVLGGPGFKPSGGYDINRGSTKLNNSFPKYDRKEPMKSTRTKSLSSETLHLVKGTGTPLNAAQRELVALFVAYLRQLPAHAGDKTHSQYLIINLMLHAHYRDLYPDWEKCGTGYQRCAEPEELPDGGEHFNWLTMNASTSHDPIVARRNRRLEAGEAKPRILKLVEQYRQDRPRP